MGETVTISAEATDIDGSVAKVAFYANSTLITEDTSSPFRVNWLPSEKAEYVLTAVAVDNQGAIDRDTVSVTAGATIETIKIFSFVLYFVNP